MGTIRELAGRMLTATSRRCARHTDERGSSSTTAALVMAIVVTGALVVGSIVIALLIDTEAQLERLPFLDS